MSSVHISLIVCLVIALIVGAMFSWGKQEIRTAPESVQMLSPQSLPASASALLHEKTDLGTAGQLKEQMHKQPFRRELLSGGWYRLAHAQVALQNLPISPEISRQIGMAIGDARFFWKGMVEEAPDSYWRKYDHTLLQTETRWRLLQKWPAGMHTSYSLFLTLGEWFRRPLTSSDNILFGAFCSYFPRWLKCFRPKAAFSLLLAPVRTLGLVPLLSLTKVSGRDSMVLSATLQNIGWSWVEMSPVANIPEQLEGVAAQWWLESGHPVIACQLVDPAQDSLFAGELEDAALAHALVSPEKKLSARSAAWLKRASSSFQGWLERNSASAERKKNAGAHPRETFVLRGSRGLWMTSPEVSPGNARVGKGLSDIQPGRSLEPESQKGETP